MRTLTVFTVSVCGQLWLFGAPAAVSDPQAAANLGVVASYGKLPLSFEPNLGQTGSPVKFLAHGRGYTLYLTATDAVLELKSSDTQAPALPQKTGSTSVALSLLGSNPSARVTGSEELPGKSNYFIGNDPSKWRTNVPNYKKVIYKSVYPGIDLVYYGNQGQLEYDFVVAPGADPGRIRFSARGADASLDAGDIVIGLPGEQVRVRTPVIYQQAESGKRAVQGRYRLTSQNQFAFELGPYDRHKTLVIDPALAYSTYLGGSSRDLANAVTVDSAGDAYVTGTTRSADFPVTKKSVQGFSGGNCGGLPCRDIFVVKFNPQGSALIYSTFIGGTGDDIPGAIALDNSLQIYVSGSTLSADFPTTKQAFQTAYGGAGAFQTGDAFILKLNRDGSGLAYSTYVGGSGDEVAYRVVVDNSGNAYIPGFTTSSNFPSTPGAYKSACTNSPCYDAFVAKLDPTGKSLVYSTFLGGTLGGQITSASGLALDASGNVYVTGLTANPDFPTTAGAYKTSCGTDAVCNGTTDAFITKLNPTGSGLVYSTFVGGSGFDNGYAVQVDTTGAAYITGSTVSTDFPVSVGAPQGTYGGGSGCTTYFCGDAFASKLNPAGSALAYSTYIGGTADDGAFSGVLAPGGAFYVVGQTNSINFPAVGALQLYGGNTDAFITKVNSAGSGFDFSTPLGGTDIDTAGAGGIALDTIGNIYVVGRTVSTNFPTTQGTFQTQCGTDGLCNSGNSDGFVSKIGNPNVILFAQPTDTISVTTGTTLSNAMTIEARVLFTEQYQNYRLIFNEWTFGYEDKALLAGLSMGGGLVTGDAFPTTNPTFYTVSTPIALNQWHDVAFVYNGVNSLLFLDGKLIGSTPSSGAIGNGPGKPVIGANFRDGGIVPSFSGYLSSLRVSDSARYSGNYTPPTGDYPNDGNTVMLFDFHAAPGTTMIKDSSKTGGVGKLGTGFTGATSPTFVTAPGTF